MTEFVEKRRIIGSVSRCCQEKKGCAVILYICRECALVSVCVLLINVVKLVLEHIRIYVVKLCICLFENCGHIVYKINPVKGFGLAGFFVLIENIVYRKIEINGKNIFGNILYEFKLVIGGIIVIY